MSDAERLAGRVLLGAEIEARRQGSSVTLIDGGTYLLVREGDGFSYVQRGYVVRHPWGASFPQRCLSRDAAVKLLAR